MDPFVNEPFKNIARSYFCRALKAGAQYQFSVKNNRTKGKC